ncbi:hypothetical protein [Methylobacterium durans]|uniref:DUF465 domain-containing protein n=1 Tax=Methylobacterium durans TaxID=2202825 RepID=A0A2U8W3A1_9HYPH|nr:hypothetical protein [Methylobacterium durans]AWN39842.1 hypothetical protein DK389_03955 [Methylobacterium durans]
MITPVNETPLEGATRHIVEAERRWDRQIDLVAKLAGNEAARAAAEEKLLEIRTTLRLARVKQALLRALGD